jgi:hypothetical protein
MPQNHPPVPTPTSTPKTTFAVHSDKLRSVARMITLPNRSSETIAMLLSANELRLRESTTDNGFSVAMTIEPVQPPNLAENEILSFAIPKRVLLSWGQHYDCELSFELDRDHGTLAWRGPGCSFRVQTPILFIPPKDRPEVPRHLTNVSSRVLCDAIGYAAILIDKRTANTQAFDGLEISGGAAKSGYLGGVSLYRSTILPGDLRFILPKRNVTNARGTIGKMQGAVEVAETDQEVFIKSGNTELCWKKAGRCHPIDRIFGTATNITFNVIVAEALKSVLIANIGSDRGQIVLQASEHDCSLSLRSIAPTSSYDVALKGQLRACNLAPETKLAFDINLEDLCRVFLSVRTLDADIAMSRRHLMIKSTCADYDETSVLAALD